MGEVATKAARFGPRPAGSAHSFFGSKAELQRKCSTCQGSSFFSAAGQDAVQRAPLEEDSGPELAAPEHDIARMADPERAASNTIQPQLKVGAVNDPMEAEADAMAEKVIQREAAAPMAGSEDTMIQRKAVVGAEGGDAGAEVNAGIARAKGGGAAMAPAVRRRMEDSFGVDLSGVRVHTGAASAHMNDQIGARAFTYGTDIHFNRGQYDPGSREGTRLLAHEMTHVIQQNAGLRRKTNDIQRQDTSGVLRRVTYHQTVFGPPGKFPRGTIIHEAILPLFESGGPGSAAEARGRSLFIEPKVPGAKRDKNYSGDGIAAGNAGEPDLYVADKKISINQKKTGVGFGRLNNAEGAPLPPRRSKKKMMPVQKVSEAPVHIRLADIKPGNSGEVVTGRSQIRNYVAGIKNTAAAVNAYQAAHGYTEFWEPDPQPTNDIPVPTRLRQADASSGVSKVPALRVYDWSRGKARKDTMTEIPGSLVVYKDGGGIYSYEWMPYEMPGATGNARLNNLLERLERQVEPKITGRPYVARKMMRANRPVRRKAQPKLVRSIQRRRAQPMVRRKPPKHVRFKRRQFNLTYNPWKADAEKELTSKKNQKTLKIFETVREAEKRTGKTVKKDKKAELTARAIKKVRHWEKYGGAYARFRETFDKVFDKFSNFAENVRKRLRCLPTKSGRFGSWVTAAARSMFKVAKIYGKWAFNQIVDKLMESLQTGMSNLISELADAATPEGVKSKIEELEAMQATYAEKLQKTQDDIEQMFFGEWLKKIETFATFQKYAEGAATLVNIVRWGIKLAACASPPLVGCLWNLAISALEAIFAKIIESCWFMQRVFKWMGGETSIKAIRDLMNFPGEIAKSLAEKGNGLIPLPAGVSSKLFADISFTNDFQMDCSAGRGGGGGGGQPLTEHQKALIQLAEDLGPKKFEALLELMMKRGAGASMQLDAERVAQIRKAMTGVTADMLKKAAAGDMSENTVPLNDFLKQVSKLSSKEEKRASKRKIDYEKAAERNKARQKELGWDKEKFIEKERAGEIAVDSKAFADAVYDAQELIGVTPDGIAGPYTTRAFYWRNRQKDDPAFKEAFKKSQKIIADAEAKRAEGKAAKEGEGRPLSAEDRALQKELGKPYPKKSELVAALNSFDWSKKPAAGHGLIGMLKGQKVIILVTRGNVRLGCNFKHMVRKDANGQNRDVIIDTSDFVVMDDMAKGDTFFYNFHTLNQETGLSEMERAEHTFPARKAGTTVNVGDLFSWFDVGWVNLKRI